MILHGLGFEAALAHALKTNFNCTDIFDLSEASLRVLFEIARTWRGQANLKANETAIDLPSDEHRSTEPMKFRVDTLKGYI